MKTRTGLSVFTLLIVPLAILSAEDLAPPVQRKPAIIPRPRPAAGFKIKVESKPRFPQEKPGDASEPRSVRSLSIVVQPEKTEFAGNGPLSFLVTLKNTSDQPLDLYALDLLGLSPKLVIANQDNANQWTLTGQFGNDKPPRVVRLEAGASKTYTLAVEGKVVIPPRPIPFPQPIPRPLPAGNRRRPNPAIWPIANPLPCGQGKCRGQVFLEFKADPLNRIATPWTGKLASAPFEFRVGKPQPIVVPPVVGQPVTKQQAITLAKTAAERALNANYQPIAGVRPVHQGDWIENAAQTARVTELKNGGWEIAWTNFAKGGFSHNVKIGVSQTGQTDVKEVFTGYSAK